MTIEDILKNCEPGDEVSQVAGRVVAVYDRTKGKVSKGPRKGKPYSVQNLTLVDKDDDDVSIKMGLWNVEDLDYLKGEEVTFKGDMKFKRQRKEVEGEMRTFVSIEAGKGTKIITDAEPETKRESGDREERQTPGPAAPSRRDNSILWQVCLKSAAWVVSANVGSKDPIADTLRIARAFFAAEPPPLPASENKKPAAEPKKKAVKEMSEDEINDELARGAKPHPSQTAKPRKTAKPDPEPETGEDTTYKSGEDDPW